VKNHEAREANLNVIKDEDIAYETLKIANTDEMKINVMNYLKYKIMMKLREPSYVLQISRNPFTNVIMSGRLSKKTTGVFDRW